VNLVGPFRLTKVLAGAMVLRRRGLLVHVSSDAAVSAYPRWGAYGVSKAALDHLARSWAAELEGTGVRVLSVDPGEMDTRMHAEAVPGADRETLADPADVARRLADMMARAEAIPSGTRLLASAWEVAS
jgi:NAD(P)-dependent dehydrogenase (short-subunit alcohol dehydrogenase family)